MGVLFFIYKLAFWVPTVASIAMLIVSLRDGIVSRPIVPVVWCAGAFLIQWVFPIFSPLWALGLVGQVVVAVYLAIKLKADF